MGSWVDIKVSKPICSEFQRPFPCPAMPGLRRRSAAFLAGTVYGAKRENQTGEAGNFLTFW
jgi:hypothetical protein